MKRARTVCIAILFLMLCCSCIVDLVQNKDAILHGHYRTEAALVKQAAAQQTCMFSDQQGIRYYHFSKYAIDKNYTYFAYSNSIVDVYDHGGNFQFSIIMPDFQNGGVGLRIQGGQLLLLAKNDSVYIFEGKTLVATLSGEQAEDAGLDYSWFITFTQATIDRQYVYLLDENGNRILQHITPQVIRNNWPLWA